MVPYNVDAQYSELHVLQKYSRNQFFVYVHPSSTVHLIFLFVSCFLIKEVDQNQTALCALWPGGNPILAAIFLWRLSALPFMTRCWCVMWWGTEMSVFWQGSQKQFLGNLNCSKLEITLKTSNQVISGFKFPATTASWTSAVLRQLQLWRYHWRLVSSLRQRDQTVKMPDTWLPRVFLSYLIICNLFWKQNRPRHWCLWVCFNITIFLIEEKYSSCT